MTVPSAMIKTAARAIAIRGLGIQALGIAFVVGVNVSIDRVHAVIAAWLISAMRASRLSCFVEIEGLPIQWSADDFVARNFYPPNLAA